MEPLHDDNRVLIQLQVPVGHHTASCEKIKPGQQDGFPLQQLRKLLAEQRGIYGVDVLQIQFSIRAGGNLIPVPVIVVQGD